MNYFEKYKEYPLTYGLIIVNVLMFIIPQIFSSLHEPLYQALALNDYWAIQQAEIYRFVSAIFLHADAIHLVMNMVSLYLVGRMIERLFSKTAYLSIYFLTAFFGSILSLYVHTNTWGVGASGAIFGLFGALAGFAFFHRKTMKDQFIAFMKDFGVILLVNLAIGFIFPSIDVSAHIGGLFTGIIGGYMVAKSSKLLWVYLTFSFLLWVISYFYLDSLFSKYVM